MRFSSRRSLCLSLLILFFSIPCYAQTIRQPEKASSLLTANDTTRLGVRPNKWIDSIHTTYSNIQRLLIAFDLPSTNPDSNKKLFNANSIADSNVHIPVNGLSFPRIPEQSSKQLFQFNGGSVCYDGIYRSSIDTPFREDGVFQQFLSLRVDFTLNEAIPLSLTYFQRETNSKFFRDYRDIRVEFNPMLFDRLKVERLNRYISKISSQKRDPNIKPALLKTNEELASAERSISHESLVNKLIEARLTLLLEGKKPSDSAGHLNSDSSVREAQNVIKAYDSLQLFKAKLTGFRDSLQMEFVKMEKRILAIQQFLSINKSKNTEGNEKLNSILKEEGLSEKEISKLTGGIGSVKKFAVGRVSPNMGDLTLRSINIQGIDFEYNRKIYFALAAGLVDFRSRDFYYSPKSRAPQFLYAVKLGYGKKEGSHAYFTAFRGKKQLFSTSSNGSSIQLYGIGFETRYNLNKNHYLFTEIAQSVSPDMFNPNTGSEKPKFSIADKSNKAFSFRWFSFFPKTRSRVELFYQYRGIHFQNFTSYYNNAILNSWHIKTHQYFWKRKIQLSASVIKNSFENPFMTTRYTGNTVLKNVQVGFRHKSLPSFSFGLMPSSQLTMIDGHLSEHYFQALQTHISHQYPIGIARGFSTVSYHKFYNDSKDTGFLYFNSRNLFITQSIQFLQHTASINVSHTANSENEIMVVDAGASSNVKKSSLGGGVKINSLNRENVKLGYYLNLKTEIGKLGQLSLWAENAYVPGRMNLMPSQFYTIGFTRYFK